MGCFSSDTRTTTSSTGPPDWIKQAGKQTVNKLDQVSGREFPSYDPDKRVADMSQTRQSAFDLGKQLAGQRRPAMNQAVQETQQTAQGQQGTIPTTDIQKYMNPYQDQVVDTTTQAMQEELAQAQNRLMNDFAAQGAFGGARQAIAQTENLQNFSNEIGQQVAQLQQQGFDRATQLATQDANRQLQASGQLADVARAGQQMDQTDVDFLNKIGQQEQQQRQAELDAAYEEFMRKVNYPERMTQLRANTLSGVPFTQTSTQQQLAPNSTAQTIGAVGSLAGGVGSLASALSDRRRKYDVRAVDVLPQTGLTVYEYGLDGFTGRVVGVMADEVAQTLPEAIIPLPSGYRGVDYAKVMEAENG